jgi:hypothetical protein
LPSPTTGLAEDCDTDVLFRANELPARILFSCKKEPKLIVCPDDTPGSAQPVGMDAIPVVGEKNEGRGDSSRLISTFLFLPRFTSAQYIISL